MRPLRRKKNGKKNIKENERRNAIKHFSFAGAQAMPHIRFKSQRTAAAGVVTLDSQRQFSRRSIRLVTRGGPTNLRHHINTSIITSGHLRGSVQRGRPGDAFLFYVVNAPLTFLSVWRFKEVIQVTFINLRFVQ